MENLNQLTDKLISKLSTALDDKETKLQELTGMVSELIPLLYARRDLEEKSDTPLNKTQAETD